MIETYQCEKCRKVFSGEPTSRLDCLKCEKQPVPKSKYEAEEYVLYDGVVCEIMSKWLQKGKHSWCYHIVGNTDKYGFSKSANQEELIPVCNKI